MILRPPSAADKRLIAASFDRLRAPSFDRWFFLHLPRFSPGALEGLIDVEHHDRETVPAVAPVTSEVLSAARYGRLGADTTTAEAAVVVVDDWHYRGVGAALLDSLVCGARQEGIRRFSAQVLGESPGALSLFAHLGQSVNEVDHRLSRWLSTCPLCPASVSVCGACYTRALGSSNRPGC